MANSYSVVSGMSTEKYHKVQLVGNIARAGVSNAALAFLVLKIYYALNHS